MEFINDFIIDNYEEYPFPHIIIDNFLKINMLENILLDINKLNDIDADIKHLDKNSPYEYNKYAFTNNCLFGNNLQNLFIELNSKEFISKLENLTGIKDLITNDITLQGAGIHRIKNEGYLQLHTDFNSYNNKYGKLDRRINLLLYMNKEWKEQYNGMLCLCDKDKNICVKKILPLLNRCIIFNTTNKSIHGHPEKLNIPDDIARQSIAVYYYTKNINGINDFEGDCPHSTIWYPNIKVYYVKILYGTKEKNIDITDICYNNLMNNNIIIIPPNDIVRVGIFSDPTHGVVKNIYIIDYNNNILEFDENYIIKIDTLNKNINYINNNEIKIKYGTKDFNIEVTKICFISLILNNLIVIPSNDHVRAHFFTDPLPGINKKIFITDFENNILEFDDNYIIKIDIFNKKIITFNKNEQEIVKKLENLQSKLNLIHGTFDDELPEQKLCVRYLKGNEKILEIGGNIGRTSLIISSILNKNNNNNLVTMESNLEIANQLHENKDLNNMNFFIENSALSKSKMIQHSWNSKVSDVLLDGYSWINTVSYDYLLNKYNIVFDTLIIDCEGAFYYILKDFPEILNNINLIIIENDFPNKFEKEYVDEIFKKNNFYLDYIEDSYLALYYSHVSFNNFHEVWKKYE